MDFRTALMFLILSGLTFFGCRNSALEMIKRIGVNSNSRYYPKHYTSTKRWMKKLFKIKQKMIPKYLFYQLYMSLFFAILGPINIIISFLWVNCIKGNDVIMEILVWFHWCLALIETIYSMVMYILFKHRS